MQRGCKRLGRPDVSALELNIVDLEHQLRAVRRSAAQSRGGRKESESSDEEESEEVESEEFRGFINDSSLEEEEEEEDVEQEDEEGREAAKSVHRSSRKISHIKRMEKVAKNPRRIDPASMADLTENTDFAAMLQEVGKTRKRARNRYVFDSDEDEAASDSSEGEEEVGEVEEVEEEEEEQEGGVLEQEEEERELEEPMGEDTSVSLMQSAPIARRSY